jgi:hemolysin III
MRIKEPVSGFTHLAGALLSAAGLPILIYIALERGIRHVISFSVFGASLILLYTASALYHLLPLSPEGTKLFRRIDHILIFVLIAGTYTPFCLVPLWGIWGWALLATVWLIAIGGIFMKIYWLHAPRWLSTLVYVGMGSLIVIALLPLVRKVPPGGIAWLMGGGLCYLIGAIFYGVKWPNFLPGVFGFHELWHLLVMAGSFSHFWTVLKYLV